MVPVVGVGVGVGVGLAVGVGLGAGVGVAEGSGDGDTEGEGESDGDGEPDGHGDGEGDDEGDGRVVMLVEPSVPPVGDELSTPPHPAAAPIASRQASQTAARPFATRAPESCPAPSRAIIDLPANAESPAFGASNSCSTARTTCGRGLALQNATAVTGRRVTRAATRVPPVRPPPDLTHHCETAAQTLDRGRGAAQVPATAVPRSWCRR
jgi:hypothetical protein